ncbi:hypothetical protein scyTo_0022249, partial [Scyliorhinus torazame]|nr:hypothetical protein [Scyliorhinus torazame]
NAQPRPSENVCVAPGRTANQKWMRVTPRVVTVCNTAPVPQVRGSEYQVTTTLTLSAQPVQREHSPMFHQQPRGVKRTQ